MKNEKFLIFAVLGTLVSLFYTLNHYVNGESWPRIWNETFIFWIVTIVFYVIHFSKSKKRKK
tara:strand:+ start:377 stop:562 length:186 start_codon:yes stop_codon:yes gene_type:complete